MNNVVTFHYKFQCKCGIGDKVKFITKKFDKRRNKYMKLLCPNCEREYKIGVTFKEIPISINHEEKKWLKNKIKRVKK